MLLQIYIFFCSLYLHIVCKFIDKVRYYGICIFRMPRKHCLIVRVHRYMLECGIIHLPVSYTHLDTFMVWDTKTDSMQPLEYPWNDKLEPALFGIYEVDGKVYKTGGQMLLEQARCV